MPLDRRYDYYWAGSGLSALEFTFGKIDIRGAISRCEALL